MENFIFCAVTLKILTKYTYIEKTYENFELW